MATLLANDFSFFQLTPEEELSSKMLPVGCIQNIQNKLSMAATRKLNMKLDPLNPLAAVQEEAELHGEMNALRLLIIESQEATTQYNAGQKQFTQANNPNQASSIFPSNPT